MYLRKTLPAAMKLLSRNFDQVTPLALPAPVNKSKALKRNLPSAVRPGGRGHREYSKGTHAGSRAVR